jgi:hypothetical protein
MATATGTGTGMVHGPDMIMMAMATEPVMATVMVTGTSTARAMATANVIVTGYCKIVHSHKCTNASTKSAHSWVTHSMTKNAKKIHPHIHTGSLHMLTGTQSLHMGIGLKKVAYGDSPFANGCCMHMVINRYKSTPIPLSIAG